MAVPEHEVPPDRHVYRAAALAAGRRVTDRHFIVGFELGLIDTPSAAVYADRVMRGLIDGKGISGPFVSIDPGAVPLDTPEERDFLELAGGWLTPEQRHVGQPIRDAGDGVTNEEKKMLLQEAPRG